MSKVVKVHLEWIYTPPDYLEEPITIHKPGIHLEISQGVAIASIEPATFENNSSISDDLTKIVEDRLYAVQVTIHKKFSLNEPLRSDLREDGGKNHFLKSVDSIAITDTVDLVATDKEGNVISDTKQERLEKQKWFAETVDKHRGNTALDQMLKSGHDHRSGYSSQQGSQSIKVDSDAKEGAGRNDDHGLKSYRMSVNEPDNELIHLYEIRDALSAFFRCKINAMKKLDITEKEWKVLGISANDKSSKQGRHRGKLLGNLRAVELSKLEEVRRTARNFIEKYLIYLEKS